MKKNFLLLIVFCFSATFFNACLDDKTSEMFAEAMRQDRESNRRGELKRDSIYHAEKDTLVITPFLITASGKNINFFDLKIQPQPTENSASCYVIRIGGSDACQSTFYTEFYHQIRSKKILGKDLIVKVVNKKVVNVLYGKTIIY